MREFQDYTKASQAARWRRLLWSLSVGLLAAVLMVGIGIRAGAVPPPMETLGYDAQWGSEANRHDGSRSEWLRGLLGGQEIPDGPFNVLVLGVDERPASKVEGSRTDTIMIVQVVPDTGEIKLLSIPRDLMIEVEPGVEGRINSAYAYGGIEQTMRVVQDYTRVPIEHYAVVDFWGFRRVIDAMGGVEVDVEDEIPPKHGIEDGLQTLDGSQALFYARYRKTEGGDLDRIEHQQRLISALRSKALRWDTVARLPQIARVMNRNFETNLGFDQGLSIGRILIHRGRNAQMTSARLEGTPKTLPNGDQVLVPNEEANEALLAEFRY